MSGTERTDVPAHEEVRQQRTRIADRERNRRGQLATPATGAERERITALTREVGVALIQKSTLHEGLQSCAQALVTNLDAAFARIWTFNAATNMLEMQASAGLYTHLDGAHSRVPVGALKIGLIASERRPHLTNQVIGDPRVNDQEWARREGMVAFAGYPLLVEDALVGVMALFSRTPLSPVILDAMASVANTIALGVERKRVEDEHTQALRRTQTAAAQAEAARLRLARILDNLPDGFMIFDTDWRYVYINPNAEPYAGKPARELLGKVVWDEFPTLVDSPFYVQYHDALDNQRDVHFEIYSALLAAWFDIHAYPIPDGIAVYFRNITERKLAEEERARLFASAERARAEAEETLRTRNDFLSSITHDLKTPLTAMSANIQLLQRLLSQDTPTSRSRMADRLQSLAGATVKMSGMLEELLDIARLQAGQSIDLLVHPVPIVALAERVIADAQATTGNHQLVLQAPPERPGVAIVVQGDEARLDRVLSNLLSNAIKYSPDGGEILVGVTVEPDGDQLCAVIRIQDYGVGIPAADLPQIFAPFYRATNVLGRITGTGIGLASVAQVVAQHGGAITAESEEGRGSVFVIRLPCQLQEVTSGPSGNVETPNSVGA